MEQEKINKLFEFIKSVMGNNTRFKRFETNTSNEHIQNSITTVIAENGIIETSITIAFEKLSDMNRQK